MLTRNEDSVTATAAPDRHRRRLRLVVLGAGLALALLAFWLLRPTPELPPWRFTTVERGELTQTVSASGALEPIDKVDVGSQLSGLVEQVLVDFNDRVRAGQPLAIIDPSTFASRVSQSRAQLASAQADLARSRAALAEAQATARVAESTFERQKALKERGFVSNQGLDDARARLDQARAGVDVARASVDAQAAAIAQARAALATNEVDLRRTRILSPIDGIVIDRQVEPGQTVAASLQAPVLFSLARDLDRLQMRILVDEADIGAVREGQRVRFTVDAYPDLRFAGQITQVRKQPQQENNVVAYVVIAEAGNEGGKLLPGMTANADILISERPDVLKVANAALRFRPTLPGERVTSGPPGARPNRSDGGGSVQQLIDQLDLSATDRARADQLLASARAEAGGDRGARRAAIDRALDALAPTLSEDKQRRLAVLRVRLRDGGGNRATLWVLGEDGFPRPVEVRTGVSDGSMTEIMGPVRAGQQVIVGGGPQPEMVAQQSPFGGPREARPRP